MKRNLEEEILYRDPHTNEYLKTQIFEDGTSQLVAVFKDKKKAAQISMKLIEYLLSGAAQ